MARRRAWRQRSKGSRQSPQNLNQPVVLPPRPPRVGFWEKLKSIAWRCGQIIAILVGMGVIITTILLPISWIKSGYEAEKEGAKAEAAKRARESATQTSRPVAPTRVPTEWKKFTAPPKGGKPLTWPQYRHEWTAHTRYLSDEDWKREDLVGAIWKDGKPYSPDGIKILSKDERPLEGWIQFQPQ